MRNHSTLLFALCTPLLAAAQSIPAIQWQACYGGSEQELAFGSQQTSDGGYIMVGQTRSNDGQVAGFQGNIDAWVVRTNSVGEMLWQRALGGSGVDAARAVVQTMDGGFVVAGTVGSSNGDLAGIPGAGQAWVLKLDDAGAILWQRRLGGGTASCWALEQMSNGDILVAGTSTTAPSNPGCTAQGSNAWVVKLNSSGTYLWERCYGGSGFDAFYAMHLTNDGGCILAGETSSTNGDVTLNNGVEDYWVVKVDAQGNLEWQKSLGGSSQDKAYGVRQTASGEFLVTGYTSSSNGDVTGHQGFEDIWIVKLDASSNIIWQRSLGGTQSDYAYSAIVHGDESITLVGSTYSIDGDITQNSGAMDSWLLRLNADGSLRWQKTLGGTEAEASRSGFRSTDGGLVMTGYTNSNDGDVSGNHGGGDYWLVKLEAEPVGISENAFSPVLTIYPNPTSAGLVVDLILPAAELVGFSWYDATGRLLQSENATRYPAGSQQISLPTEGLPTGPLLLQITMGEQQSMQRVVKL
jgi:hypothetical protein